MIRVNEIPSQTDSFPFIRYLYCITFNPGGGGGGVKLITGKDARPPYRYPYP